MKRRLRLGREALADLSHDELRAAAAGRVDDGPTDGITCQIAGTILPPCYATLGYPCCDSACCTG